MAADLGKAQDFIWKTARLIDRYRFEALFLDGSRERVLSALRPYQNEDGGFGNALEPDLRTPLSQPIPVWTALGILDEMDAMRDPMVARAVQYLESITTPEGGVPFVLPSARLHPHAVWWEPSDPSPTASLNPTAGIAAFFHKHRIAHPWLERASAYCRTAIETTEDMGSYDLRVALAFVDHVPDRTWAEAALPRLGSILLEKGLVELDPEATGEVPSPLTFAPHPDMMARHLFGDDDLNRHLDALEKSQHDDGGWPISWQVWTPMAGLEWRGFVTVDALLMLRAYGRLP